MHLNTLAKLSVAAVLFIFTVACSDDLDQSQVDDAPSSTIIAEEAPPTGLLPEGVTPSHYRIHLNIDPANDDFTGTTDIDVTLAAATHTIWLHGRELEVSSVDAILADDSRLPLNWEQVNRSGTVNLTSERPLPAGKLTLRFTYKAPFNTSLEGLYRVDKSGLSYAFTQFEATSARLAFPSFDQPGFKTPFDIKLTIPANQVGITNTPQIAEEANADGSSTITFETTQRLPTYLIAFAVGPFDVVDWEPVASSEVRQKTIPLRGITTKGRGEEIHFALKHTAEILIALEDYFGTPYPYRKLDIIAIPDFSSGAMENAGAITYREQLILLNENSSLFDKHGYFSTHAHELAHQWFGNLVTPVWWDDLWLKESFATWNAYTVIDTLYPEQNYLDSLLNGSAWAMQEDGLSSARKIREPIVVHEDIGAAYDGITYSKGGGVLAMFEEFLGADNFRNGIRHYMNKYSGGNTTAEDFIKAITEANPQVDGKILQRAFRSFIEQAGVPQLTTALDCSNEQPQLKVSQQRYLPLGSEGSTDMSWSIPACVTLFTEEGRQSQCFIASESEQTVALNVERCPTALLPNTNGKSYYRFAMPGSQWQSLLANFDELTTHEQIATAGSLSAALNAGTISLDDYFKAAPIIAGSNSWRVSVTPRGNIYRLMDFGASEPEKEAMRAMLIQWYQPQLDQLNDLEELTPEQNQYRMLMMSTLGLRARDEALLRELTEMGVAYTGFGKDEQIKPEAIDSNYIYIALLAGVDQLGEPFADLLWKHFYAAENVKVREELLAALASSTAPQIATKVRGAILSPDLADNEIVYIINGQMSKPENHQAMWQWTQANMKAVLERIPRWRQGRLPDFFNRFCDEASADSVEATFTPFIDELESGPRYLAKSLEKIRLCAAYVEHYGNPGI